MAQHPQPVGLAEQPRHEAGYVIAEVPARLDVIDLDVLGHEPAAALGALVLPLLALVRPDVLPA
jgi:hypothetical protein